MDPLSRSHFPPTKASHVLAERAGGGLVRLSPPPPDKPLQPPILPFMPQVRGRCVAVTYNIANVVGGLGPMVCSLDSPAPFFNRVGKYCTFLLLIGICIFFWPGLNYEQFSKPNKTSFQFLNPPPPKKKHNIGGKSPLSPALMGFRYWVNILTLR